MLQPDAGVEVVAGEEVVVLGFVLVELGFVDVDDFVVVDAGLELLELGGGADPGTHCDCAR